MFEAGTIKLGFVCFVVSASNAVTTTGHSFLAVRDSREIYYRLRLPGCPGVALLDEHTVDPILHLHGSGN